jgi:hypothetical protein
MRYSKMTIFIISAGLRMNISPTNNSNNNKNKIRNDKEERISTIRDLPIGTQLSGTRIEEDSIVGIEVPAQHY